MVLLCVEHLLPNRRHATRSSHKLCRRHQHFIRRVCSETTLRTFSTRRGVRHTSASRPWEGAGGAAACLRSNRTLLGCTYLSPRLRAHSAICLVSSGQNGTLALAPPQNRQRSTSPLFVGHRRFLTLCTSQRAGVRTGWLRLLRNRIAMERQRIASPCRASTTP